MYSIVRHCFLLFFNGFSTLRAKPPTQIMIVDYIRFDCLTGDVFCLSLLVSPKWAPSTQFAFLRYSYASVPKGVFVRFRRASTCRLTLDECCRWITTLIHTTVAGGTISARELIMSRRPCIGGAARTRRLATTCVHGPLLARDCQSHGGSEAQRVPTPRPQSPAPPPTITVKLEN